MYSPLSRPLPHGTQVPILAARQDAAFLQPAAAEGCVPVRRKIQVVVDAELQPARVRDPDRGGEQPGLALVAQGEGEDGGVEDGHPMNPDPYVPRDADCARRGRSRPFPLRAPTLRHPDCRCCSARPRPPRSPGPRSDIRCAPPCAWASCSMNRARSAMARSSASPICAFSAPMYRPSAQYSTPALRARLLRFVLVHQPLRLEMASAALQVHIAAQARSAFSRQVGVVGFDVHRLRLLRLCARQRGRSLRQREGTAALLPPLSGKCGKGGGREAERHQERAPHAARPQPVSRVALHRRDLAGVRVHNRVVSVGLGVLFRIAWTSTGPFSTGELVDADALSCPTDPGRRASRAASRARASGNPELWKIAQNTPALQRDASTRSASASMCRGRSLRAGM